MEHHTIPMVSSPLTVNGLRRLLEEIVHGLATVVHGSITAELVPGPITIANGMSWSPRRATVHPYAPGQRFGIFATVDNPEAIVFWMKVSWFKYKELIPHEVRECHDINPPWSKKTILDFIRLLTYVNHSLLDKGTEGWEKRPGVAKRIPFVGIENRARGFNFQEALTQTVAWQQNALDWENGAQREKIVMMMEVKSFATPHL